MPIDMTGMSRTFLPKLLGKIAIGRKNASGYPEKLDYFIFTHPFNQNVAPVHKEMTAAMKEFYPNAVDKDTGLFKPRTIKVVLPFHNIDEVFYTSFCNYVGKSGWNCKSEDGVTATRKFDNGEKKEVPCVHSTCEWKYLTKGEKKLETCKATGLLSVMILDAPLSGGLWRFSTRSSTSVNEMLSTLKMLYAIRGSLMGLEIELKVRIVSMDTPKDGGGTQKQNVPIVSIELPHSWKALANGSGTVYGDFRQIIEAAKTSHALPNRKIIDELSMSLAGQEAGETVDDDTIDVSSTTVPTETTVEEKPTGPIPDSNLF